MKRSIIPLLLLLLFLTCLPTVAAVADEPSVSFGSYQTHLLSRVDSQSMTLTLTYDMGIYMAEIESSVYKLDNVKITVLV